MRTFEETGCRSCGGEMRKYDEVNRIVRSTGGEVTWVKITRVRCVDCHILRRELPDYLTPFKHYDCEIINGVLEGHITTETYGYENYPCEKTMERWISALILQGV